MKRWKERFQAMAAAITFVEDGEWKTAEGFVEQTREVRNQQRSEKRKDRRQRPRARVYRT